MAVVNVNTLVVQLKCKNKRVFKNCCQHQYVKPLACVGLLVVVHLYLVAIPFVNN